MTPNYGFGTIDWSTIANDPYFMQLQKNNIAFQAAQQDSANQAQLVPDTISVPTVPTVQQVDYANVQPQSSGGLGWIAGATGAAALITGAAAIKHGGIGKGLKALASVFTGKAGETVTEAAAKAANKASKRATSKLTAIRNANGTFSYLVPKETVTFKTNEMTSEQLAEITKKYGINLEELQNISIGSSKLEGGVFRYKDNTITFGKDGKILEMKNPNGENIMHYFFDKEVTLDNTQKEFLTELEEYIANAQKMEKGWEKDFVSYDITREVGDNIAKISYEGGGKHTITSLTTLEHLDKEHKAVRAWLHNHPEDKEIFLSKLFEEGRIPEGAKVGVAEIPYKNKVCRFENGEFKGIYEGEKYHAKGSTDCDSFLLDEETNLKELYSNFLKGKFPRGIDTKRIKVEITS